MRGRGENTLLLAWNRVNAKIICPSKDVLENGLSRKTSEWILHFNGESQDLYENYFKIGSGYALFDNSKERVNIVQGSLIFQYIIDRCNIQKFEL